MNEEKELYQGHAEDQRKREELASRIERAHAAVLPGALREAFGGEAARGPLETGALGLQPVTLGLTANLERIKSPLLDIVRIMREVFSGSREGNASQREEGEGDPRMELIRQKVSELKFDEEQIAETVFIFTRPQKRVRKLLDAGHDTFREAAMDELGDKLHPTQIAALQRACAQHYVASFATIISYGSPPVENGEAVFHLPSPSNATGSVGGLTSWGH
ncbi:MAG TPA: hypothetical protein VK811_02990 [Candidatus Acidoferrum sp.]|nr:hypothetical protein [Candidatus Acidoferrum sp.]